MKKRRIWALIAVLLIVVGAVIFRSMQQPATPNASTTPSAAKTSSSVASPSLSPSPSASVTAEPTPSQASAEPATPVPSTPEPTVPTPAPVAAGEMIIIGSLLFHLPAGYDRSDGSTVQSVENAEFTGPSSDYGLFNGQQHISTLGLLSPSGEVTSFELKMLLRGQCPTDGSPVKPTVVDDRNITLASGTMPAHLMRSTYQCGDLLFTYVNWFALNGSFSAYYFGLFDRDPVELTTAFSEAQHLQ